MYGDRVSRWERAVEWPLTIAAIVFLIAYATQILAYDRGFISAIAEAIVWVTWAMFAVDYIVRLAITENRRRWFIRHILDLAIVILPMLRPLRLMRFLTIIAIIQRGAGSMLRGRVLVYTAAATVLTILVAGLAVFDAERGSHGPIQNLGDAIWWAFVTITTVGYGDYFPVTIVGRIVAVGLMIGGIALIGIVTATLASWIVEKISLETQMSAATEAQVEQLRAEVAEMKEMLRALQREPQMAEDVDPVP
jgi:voltage-gated potassium channel